MTILCFFNQGDIVTWGNCYKHAIITVVLTLK